MDQDLKAYLDEQFAKVDQRFEQVDRRFEQVDRRFEQVDRRFEQVDRRFEQVDHRFEQVDHRFEEFRQETRGRFDRMEDEVHLNRIVTEALRDDLRQVADGVAANSEKLERLQQLFGESHTKLEARITRLEAAKRTALRTPKK